LNCTYQLLFYAHDDNLLGKNINNIKNTEALLDVSKEIYLEVNA
jgi:hypothetical protein